jgi:serine protease Do
MDDKDFNYVNETVVDKAGKRRKRIRNIILIFLAVIILGTLSIVIYSNSVADNTGNSSKSGSTDSNESNPIKIILQDDAYEGQMDFEDYKTIYNSLKEAGESASKYIVTVTAVNDDEDWITSYMDDEGVTSGLITSIDDDICILTDYASVSSADKIMVKFFNGDSIQANLRKADTASGIAILCIPADNVKKGTRQSIGVAPFGDLKQIECGDPVIIVGNPYGANHYMTFGALTSITDYISITDDAYRVLVTNVVVSGNENGFVIDPDGKIIGFISTSLSSPGSVDNVVNGVAICDITAIINRLSKGQNIPYLGITGQDITEEIVNLVKIGRASCRERV